MTLPVIKLAEHGTLDFWVVDLGGSPAGSGRPHYHQGRKVKTITTIHGTVHQRVVDAEQVCATTRLRPEVIPPPPAIVGRLDLVFAVRTDRMVLLDDPGTTFCLPPRGLTVGGIRREGERRAFGWRSTG